METLIPRALSNRPSDAAVIPLPSELTTPPVKKIYFAISGLSVFSQPARPGTLTAYVSFFSGR